MHRLRAGSFLGLSLIALGCGARTGLLAESDPQWQNIGGSSGSSGRGGNAGTGNNGGGGSGGMIIPPPPVRTNCQLSGNDPRVAGIKADEVAHLDGADFVTGSVKSYHWTVQMEDCDAFVPNAQIVLQDVDSRVLTFQPSRPAFYHLTLEVTGVGGEQSSCKLEVPVEGVGMRVELCWDTSTTTDLDLYLHTPFDREPWFVPDSTRVEFALNGTTCNTSNAAAELRGLPRVDWGYADSPLNTCNTPPFRAFLAGGHCPNPRAADDNNQAIASGTTERMQLDNPADGQTFRVMVQNFDNQPAQPHVFVYCGGQRAAAFNAPPSPRNFVGPDTGGEGYGVMWRAADVTTKVDGSGKVFCSATSVAGSAITINDPRF
ncbi:MAG TPA: hypothetical protein VER96_38765 [Polyangiaceae bacterium]|nr:hypothetical protein [Polyangiaceae bacterium]